MLTKATLAQIMPTNHSPQDKHSLNLWRWARRAIRTERTALFVAFATDNVRGYDPATTQASSTYIGYGNLDDGWLCGSRLSEILCTGNKATEFAYPPRRGFVIIPDWWQRYITGGKCFIDPEHLIYGRERWQESADGQERTCRWCGTYRQHLETYTEQKTRWRTP